MASNALCLYLDQVRPRKATPTDTNTSSPNAQLITKDLSF